jgi:hypothetical protein
MKRIIFLFLASFFSFSDGFGQEESTGLKHSLDGKMNGKSNLTIGGYTQIDFNQPTGGKAYHNGTLDVHRMVLLFGYQFNERAQFISEIELEHIHEVSVEQAYLNYRILPWLNFKGGLMLIPMGIINEYHEPPTFNGVERPNVDNKIVPTTWRELGAGFTGVISRASLKYQIYLINGFKSYNGVSYLNGINGLRNGRQKGIESFMSTPNLATKVEYYGFSGFKIGLSSYVGKSQSSLYNNLIKNNAAGVAKADSSVVGIKMMGIDTRFAKKGWEFRGQYIVTLINNSVGYNKFSKSDLGSQLSGWYVEAAYNLFQSIPQIRSQLVPFVRYEKYDTHHKTEGNLVRNKTFEKSEITTGIGWRITSQLVVKGDFLWSKSAAETSYNGQLNLGIGMMF